MSNALGRAGGPPQRSILQRLGALVSDQRFLRTVAQLVFVALTVWALAGVWNNITSTLNTRGLTPEFEFLNDRAGFEIGGAQNYTPDDSYWQAFLVGLRNSLLVIVVGLAATTVLGILGGIFLLSTNWLVRTITRVIVEVLRNMPLLVVIFIMFFVVVLALPPLRESLTFPNDGLLLVPWRLLAAFGVLAAAWLLLRRAAPARRSAWLVGIVSAAAAGEALFALAAGSPAYSALYGAGIGHSAVVLHLLLTAGALALVVLVRPPFAPTLIGLLAGQAVGFLLFAFGVLPATGLIVETTPAFYLNNRGFVFPSLQATGRFAEWMAFVGLGIGLGVFAWVYTRRLTETTGRAYPHLAIALLILGVFTAAGWLIVSAQPGPQFVPVSDGTTTTLMPLEAARAADLLSPAERLAYAEAPIAVTLPRRQGLRFATGEVLSPEYVALTLALVIYTAAFIAEIVRAGILAVPRGQLEASRALGLSSGQTLRMVILPQALRVIIPPLTNQYLNLAKNSSLAIAISFADIYQVMNTVINQSGQSITGIFIIMVTYLIISLLISAVMNFINSRFQLVTR
jgi:general L-amino acid transport system permease protein